MKSIKDWFEYYNSVGISICPYNINIKEKWENDGFLTLNHDDNIECDNFKGLHALIGKGYVRVIHFRKLSNKNSVYKEKLLKNILRSLYLSEDYPWVICSSDTLSIIVRSEDIENMGNRVLNGNSYLLWHTKFVLPTFLPQIYFYHQNLPSFKPHLIDKKVLLSFINSWNGINEWDIVCEMKGNFAVAIKDGKKGIVYKDGTTVIEPIFDNIEHYSYDEMLAYNNNNYPYYSFILGTYGEGLVCAKEKKERWESQYVFMDKDGNKQIVLNEAWAEKNNLDYNNVSIPQCSTCRFENGLLKIDFSVDEYFGHIYEIDKQGNARYIEDVYYKEYRYIDFVEDLDYSGYETMGYWGIDDEGLRDALDDDPEAYGNID